MLSYFHSFLSVVQSMNFSSGPIYNSVLGIYNSSVQATNWGKKKEIKAVICNSTTLLPTIKSFLWKATSLATIYPTLTKEKQKTVTVVYLPFQFYHEKCTSLCKTSLGQAWNDSNAHSLLFYESVCMYSFLHLSILFYIESWYLHFNKPNGKIPTIQT